MLIRFWPEKFLSRLRINVEVRLCSLMVAGSLNSAVIATVGLAPNEVVSSPWRSLPITSKGDISTVDSSLLADGSCLFGSPESTPGSVTLIDREAIQQQAALSRNIKDIVIQKAPGVSPTIKHGRSRLSLRGRPAQILIDGVPVSSDALSGLDPELVEQIEVIAGPNSLCN